MLGRLRALFGWLPEPEVEPGYELTDGAAAVLRAAVRESKSYSHEYIGTEHILVALVEGDRLAAGLLSRRGIGPIQVREAVEQIVQPGVGWDCEARLPFTPRARCALRLAAEDAAALGQSPISPGHLFLGLLREPEGVAHAVLVGLGCDPASLGQDVLKILASST